KPDLVVSGINAGENVGVNVFYSGTVAAAAEGALLGCRAVAVSLEYSDELDFARAARHAMTVIRTLLKNGVEPGEMVSVNLPQLRPGWPVGIHVAEQSSLALSERFEQRSDPRGQPYYWLTGAFPEEESDTDVRAVRHGYIAVTPIKINLTDRVRLALMREWDWPALPSSD
ncbi:MAG: 5'/3'-nucleotidase SurE, partial [Phycisphaerae bacterium]